MTEPVVLTPIGVVRGGRSQIVEDHWGAVVSRLVLDPAVLDQAATDGLSEFSHIEVVFLSTRRPGSAVAPPTREATQHGHRSGSSPDTRRSARTTSASPSAPCWRSPAGS